MVKELIEVDLGRMNRIFGQQRETAIRLRSGPVSERIVRLKRLENWILSNQKDIHEALQADLRKNPTETDISELLPALTEIREAISKVRKWAKPRRFAASMTYLGTRTAVHYEPKGVCLIISPWNYPFNLTLGPLVSAIAAGNTFFVKPSEYTPATSELLARMVRELFPESEGIVLEGDAEVATALLALPFDHVFFTGSPAVGKKVMEAAAKNLTSITLELGGKSPTIVDETCALEDTARKIAWGKWLNAGQTCVAPDYLFVHKNVAEALVKSIGIYAGKFYGQANEYTSIVSSRHFDRLKKLAEEVDASMRYFGGTSDRNTLKMDPVAFRVDKDENLTILKEEIFGPILPIMTYTDLGEVISYINERPKPLALYIFSKSARNQQKILRETSSGTTVINDTLIQFGHPTAPFGGVNTSGIGKSHGHAGFVAFSNEKTVLKQRIGFTMAQTLYPPYSSYKNKLVQFLLRYF